MNPIINPMQDPNDANDANNNLNENNIPNDLNDSTDKTSEKPNTDPSTTGKDKSTTNPQPKRGNPPSKKPKKQLSKEPYDQGFLDNMISPPLQDYDIDDPNEPAFEKPAKPNLAAAEKMEEAENQMGTSEQNLKQGVIEQEGEEQPSDGKEQNTMSADMKQSIVAADELKNAIAQGLPILRIYSDHIPNLLVFSLKQLQHQFPKNLQEANQLQEQLVRNERGELMFNSVFFVYQENYWSVTEDITWEMDDVSVSQIYDPALQSAEYIEWEEESQMTVITIQTDPTLFDVALPTESLIETLSIDHQNYLQKREMGTLEDWMQFSAEKAYYSDPSNASDNPESSLSVEQKPWISESIRYKFRLVFEMMLVSRRTLRDLITPLIGFPLPFFLSVLGCFLASREAPGYRTYTNYLVERTCPGVSRFMVLPAKVDWETIDYTGYFQSIDWNSLRKLNYYKGSVFCTFSPNMSLFQNRQAIGLFDMDPEELEKTSSRTINIDSKEVSVLPGKLAPVKKTAFISSRDYHALVDVNEVTEKLQASLLELADMTVNDDELINALSRWHPYLTRLDLIPQKMGHVFEYRGKVPVPPTTRERLRRFIFRRSKRAPVRYTNYKLKLDRLFSTESNNISELSSGSVSPKQKYVKMPRFTDKPGTAFKNLPEDYKLSLIPRGGTKDQWKKTRENWSKQSHVEKMDNLLRLKFATHLGPQLARRSVYYALHNNLHDFRQIIGAHSRGGYTLNQFNLNKTLVNPTSPVYKAGVEKQGMTGIEKRLHTILQKQCYSFQLGTMKPKITNQPYGHYWYLDFIKKAKTPFDFRRNPERHFAILDRYQRTLFQHLERNLSEKNHKPSLVYLVCRKIDPFLSNVWINSKSQSAKVAVVRAKVEKARSTSLKRRLSRYAYVDQSPFEVGLICSNQAMNPFDLDNVEDLKKLRNILVEIHGPEMVVYPRLQIVFSQPNPFYGFELLQQYKLPYQYAESTNFFAPKKHTFGLKFKHHPPDQFDLKRYIPENKIEEEYEPDIDAKFDWEEWDGKMPFPYTYSANSWLWRYNNQPYIKQKLSRWRSEMNKRPAVQHYQAPPINVEIDSPLFDPSYFNTEIEQFKSKHAYVTKGGFAPDRWIDKANYGRNSVVIYQKINIWNPAYVTNVIAVCFTVKSVRGFILYHMDALNLAIREFFETFEWSAWTHLTRRSRLVIRSTGVRFDKVVGGEALLGQLAPVILFLRSGRQPFSRIKSTPVPKWARGVDQSNSMAPLVSQSNNYVNKGILLVGPPGTGKTFLVKALAGEANVPIVLYGREKYREYSDLGIESSGVAQKAIELRSLFQTAKRNTPCIVFIDEIDGFGPDRKDVQQSFAKDPNGPSLVYNQSPFRQNNAFNLWESRLDNNYPSLDFNKSAVWRWQVYNPSMVHMPYFKSRQGTFVPEFYPEVNFKDAEEATKNKPFGEQTLLTLTQLLSELDSVSEHQMVVIGATNRPRALDPALTRPGRLNKVIYMDLPDRQKRFKLLKFYSEHKLLQPIDWEQFSYQTSGLSPAHLKAALNLSAFKNAYRTIASQPIEYTDKPIVLHTPESVAFGIECVRFNDHLIKKRFIPLVQQLNRSVFSVFWYDAVKTNSHLRFYLPNTIKKGISQQMLMYWINQGIVPVISEDALPIKQVSPERISQHLQQAKSSQTPPAITKPKRRLTPEQIEASREKFYQKHRQTFLTLYLLSEDRVPTSSEQSENDPSIPRGVDVLLADASQEQKQIINKFFTYADNYIDFNLVGSQLLAQSSLTLHPLVSASLSTVYKQVHQQWVDSGVKVAYFPRKNLVRYLLLKYPKQSLFTDLSKSHHKLLKDPDCLLRAAYYASGMAIIRQFLIEGFTDAPTYSMWSMLINSKATRDQQRELVKKLRSDFFHRYQYENYLFTLVAGKACETMILGNREIVNQSTMGQGDLDKATWLVRIMTEHNFFYGTHIGLLRQVCIDSLPRTTIKEVKFDYTLEQQDEKYVKQQQRESEQNQVDIDKFQASMESKRKSVSNPTKWWEAATRQVPSRLNARLRKWTGFFKSTENKYRREKMVAPFHYDQYIQNTVNNGQIMEQPLDEKFEQSFRDKQLATVLTHMNVNWNQQHLSQTDEICCYLLAQAFTKVLERLDDNREIVDYFAYYFLINDEITDKEANRLVQMLLTSRRHKQAQIKNIDIVQPNGETPPEDGETPPSGGPTPPSGGPTPPSGGAQDPPLDKDDKFNEPQGQTEGPIADQPNQNLAPDSNQSGPSEPVASTDNSQSSIGADVSRNPDRAVPVVFSDQPGTFKVKKIKPFQDANTTSNQQPQTDSVIQSNQKQTALKKKLDPYVRPDYQSNPTEVIQIIIFAIIVGWFFLFNVLVVDLED